ncbi:MAG: Lactoylglutathione lyase [Myxococcaceae bacterium]|nr:Lactoylglutathione lyase [Myxococcaceae bacterium]
MRLHHLALRTADPPALARWYVHLFGLDLWRDTPGASLWLGLGDAALMIEPAAPGEPAVPAGSMEFFALRVTPAGRDAFVARCLAAAVPVEQQTAFTVYVRDPDGRRVGVSCFDGFPSAPPVE